MFWLLFSIIGSAFSAVPYNEKVIFSLLEKSKEHRKLRLSVHAPKIPDSAYVKASKGKVATGLEKVPGYAASKGWGVAVFDVPIERLWAGLNDEQHHTEMSPVNYIEIVQGKSCEDHRRVLMILPVPVINDRWWIVKNRINDKLKQASSNTMRELTWQHVKDPVSHPKSAKAKKLTDGSVAVTFTQGAWLLIKLDDKHTLGEYYTWADPAGVIPAGPASMFVADSIVDFFDAMRQYAINTKQIHCMETLD